MLTAHGALVVHQADHSPVDTNSPIPYDEERIFIVGDLFNLNDADLVNEALNGRFIGAANVPPRLSTTKFRTSSLTDKTGLYVTKLFLTRWDMELFAIPRVPTQILRSNQIRRIFSDSSLHR